MKVLILGGTGVISRAIVERLLEMNSDITLFNRGNKQLPFKGDVRQITGNITDRGNFETEMKKHSFDAVIDMICFNEEDAKSVVRAFRGNTGQLIICSSVAVYRRPYRSLPISEDKEELLDEPSFSYGFHKAEMERYFNSLIDSEKLPVTMIRPSLTFGPGSANIGVLRQNYGIVDRILKGKPLVMFGDGTTPCSFTFAPDLAKGFVGVINNSCALGQTYHISSEDRNIWEDLYLEFGRILGREPIIRHISSELLAKAAPNLCSHLHIEKTYGGILDNSKIRTAIPGYKADISLHEGLKGILAWYEECACSVDYEKDAFEDKLIELHSQWTAQAANLYTR